MNHIFAEFASLPLLILKGLLVGIIASAPMGPVGILCIQRTIQKGRPYGIVTGAGAALSDIFYALITGLGMSFVMDFIGEKQNIFWLKLAGSVMLFIFGIPGNWYGQCIGYLSIVAGAMLWWLGLTYVINKMRNNFGPKGIKRLNRTIGTIVLTASIIYAGMTLFNLSLY